MYVSCKWLDKELGLDNRFIAIAIVDTHIHLRFLAMFGSLLEFGDKIIFSLSVSSVKALAASKDTDSGKTRGVSILLLVQLGAFSLLMSMSKVRGLP
jgi:hypothetical protein